MEYNPFLPEVRENPYPYYAYLREHAPVYQVPGVGFWAVSRYDDVLSVLRNPQVFSSASFFAAIAGDLNPFPPESPALISCDPPTHTRMRKLVNRAFTPRRVASMEQHSREVAQQLIERLPAHGEFDLGQEVAIPVPVIVIAELLGVPPERRADFRRWADTILRTTDGKGVPLEEYTGLRQGLDEFFAYFRGAIAVCRKEPGDNLISDLVRAEEENQTLTAEEILSLTVLLLAAGSETTTNAVGSAMLALCDHPEQMAHVRANSTLVPNVVEEAVRYESPIQLFPRQTTQEVKIADTMLPAGTLVMAVYASAHREGIEFRYPGPHFAKMNDLTKHGAFSYAAFPNLVTVIGPNLISTMTFWPSSAGATRYDMHFIGAEPLDDNEHSALHRQIDLNIAIFEEDLGNLPSMQSSIAAGAIDQVRFGYQECRLYPLHEEIDRRIGVDLIPEHQRVSQTLGGWVER